MGGRIFSFVRLLCRQYLCECRGLAGPPLTPESHFWPVPSVTYPHHHLTILAATRITRLPTQSQRACRVASSAGRVHRVTHAWTERESTAAPCGRRAQFAQLMPEIVALPTPPFLSPNALPHNMENYFQSNNPLFAPSPPRFSYSWLHCSVPRWHAAVQHRPVNTQAHFYPHTPPLPPTHHFPHFFPTKQTT